MFENSASTPFQQTFFFSAQRLPTYIYAQDALYTRED